MDREFKPLHYHIRWSRVETLDWEWFGNRVEADKRAAELARQGETYTIEEQGGECPRCREAMKLKNGFRLVSEISGRNT